MQVYHLATLHSPLFNEFLLLPKPLLFICRVARFDLVQKYQKGENVPNDHKLYQAATDYNKWPKSISNGHNILQHFPFQGPPNFTQSGMYGNPFHLSHLIQNIKFKKSLLWNSDVHTYLLLRLLECRVQRPILNFTPRGKLWPPGAKLSPRGEFVP
jgi:hypothetical protein